MKFYIDQRNLIKPLKEVAKVLPGKTTLPILECILFRVSEDELTLVAGNTTLISKADIGSEWFQFERAGEILLPGKLILNVIEKIEGDIMIEVNNLEATIKAGRSEFHLQGLDPDEYPSLPMVAGSPITISGSVFESLVNKTIYAVSDNEATPVLCGIYFRTSTDQLKLTASDRHRLAQSCAKIQYQGQDHAASVGGLEKFTKTFNGADVEISFCSDWFIVKSQNNTLFSRIHDGTFPDTDRLIQFKSYKTKITAGRKKLLGSLDRVEAIAGNRGIVNIAVNKNKSEIEFSAKPEGSKRVTESIELIHVEGDDVKINVIIKIIKEALQALQDDEVIITFIGSLQPITFEGKGNDYDFHLVLPTRET